MSTSSFIVGALLAGFILYLAQQNRLAIYTGVLWGDTAAKPPSSGNNASSSSGSDSTIKDATTALQVAAMFA